MLVFQIGACSLELESRSAQSFGNILVGSEAVEVDGVQDRQHVEGDGERGVGIVYEGANDAIVLSKYAVTRDEPKNLIGEAGHRRKGLDFLVREAWRLQHRPLHNLVAIADECAPRFRAALHGELHPLRYAHFRQPLNQSLPSGDVAFRRPSGFAPPAFLVRITRTVQFAELILLLDG